MGFDQQRRDGDEQLLAAGPQGPSEPLTPMDPSAVRLRELDVPARYRVSICEMGWAVRVLARSAMIILSGRRVARGLVPGGMRP